MVQNSLVSVGEKLFNIEVVAIGTAYFEEKEQFQFLVRVSHNERAFTFIYYSESTDFSVGELFSDIITEMAEYYPKSDATVWADNFSHRYDTRFAGRAKYLYQANIFNGFAQILGSRRKAVEVINEAKNGQILPVVIGFIC